MSFDIVTIALGVLLGKIGHDLFVSTVVFFRRKAALKAQEKLLVEWEKSTASGTEA